MTRTAFPERGPARQTGSDIVDDLLADGVRRGELITWITDGSARLFESVALNGGQDIEPQATTDEPSEDEQDILGSCKTPRADHGTEHGLEPVAELWRQFEGDPMRVTRIAEMYAETLPVRSVNEDERKPVTGPFFDEDGVAREDWILQELAKPGSRVTADFVPLLERRRRETRRATAEFHESKKEAMDKLRHFAQKVGPKLARAGLDTREHTLKVLASGSRIAPAILREVPGLTAEQLEELAAELGLTLYANAQQYSQGEHGDSGVAYDEELARHQLFTSGLS